MHNIFGIFLSKSERTKQAIRIAVQVRPNQESVSNWHISWNGGYALNTK